MSDAGETQRDGWHLDKRVNVSIILVLAAYVVGGFLFAGKMDSRVASVEEKVSVLQRYGDEDRKAAGLIREDLREIKTMLKVLSEKR
jgi:Tfp pilus assembly protein PilO